MDELVTSAETIVPNGIKQERLTSKYYEVKIASYGRGLPEIKEGDQVRGEDPPEASKGDYA